MKKLFCVFVVGMMVSPLLAQTTKEEAILIEKKILSDAKRIGDPSVAAYSMYKLIALEGKNSTYMDSLAYVYFSSRKYASSFLAANDVLERDPKNAEILELKAISLESLGAIDKSSEVYAELFALTNNNYHGYALSNLQFSMKKFEEAYTTIQKVESLNDSGKVKVTFTINQNHTQQIELLAAIPYLKGLIEESLSKGDEAKLSYEKALKIQPEFVLAKEKLDKFN